MKKLINLSNAKVAKLLHQVLLVSFIFILSSFNFNKKIVKENDSRYFIFLINDNKEAWFSHGVSCTSESEAREKLKQLCEQKKLNFTQRILGPYADYNWAEKYRNDAIREWKNSGYNTYEWLI